MYGSEEEVVRTHHGDELRLEDHIEHGRLAVHLTAETISHSAQFHIRHIFQTEYRAVFTRADNGVLKLFHALQSSAIFHRELEDVLRTLAQ